MISLWNDVCDHRILLVHKKGSYLLLILNYFVFFFFCLIFQGYHALQSYRIAHALWNQGHKVLALALQSRISEVFFIGILLSPNLFSYLFIYFSV